MLYLKSVLAGILAVVVASLVCSIPMLWTWFIFARHSDSAGGIYVSVTDVHFERVLCVAMLAFGAGF